MTSPMGEALVDIAPMIDYIFSGEADEEFPRFCQDFLGERRLPASKIINCKPIEAMDSVSIPDFDDYFHQFAGFPGQRPVAWRLAMAHSLSSHREDVGGARNTVAVFVRLIPST